MNARNLKPWKPGQSGNPTGMARVPDHLRGVASLSPLEVVKIVSKYARMTRAELQVAATNPDTPMLEVAIASVFAQSAKTGDYQRLAFLLDRAVGKVPVVQETNDELEARRELQNLTTSELLQLVRDNVKDPEKVPE